MPAPTTHVSTSRVAFAALMIAPVCGAAVAYGARDGDGKDAAGPHAEFTRPELSRLTEPGSVRNPVLLPRDLPPGVGRTEDSDFVLLNRPVTDDRRRHAGEVWLSSYVVGALPPATGNVSGYEVYQEWQRAPERHRARCDSRRTGNQVVMRRVGDDLLTICLGPHPTQTAEHYWSTVEFTADLRRVEWLQDGGD